MLNVHHAPYCNEEQPAVYVEKRGVEQMYGREKVSVGNRKAPATVSRIGFN